MQPYRSDLEALEARHAALEAEVADKVRRRDEAARMLDEARARQRADVIAADVAAGGPERRRKRMVAVVLGSLAFLVAIGAAARILHRGDDRARHMDRVMTQFERYADEICECKNNTCVTAVTDRMSKWAAEISKDMTPDEKTDQSILDRAQVIGKRMSDCMTKALSVPEEPQPYYRQEGGAYSGQEGGNSNSRGNSNDNVNVERE